MRFRALAYIILWVVLGLLLWNTCAPKKEKPAEMARNARPDVFDAPDAPEERVIVLENEHVYTEWTSRGAGCRLVKLKQYSPKLREGEGTGSAAESEWLTLFEAVAAFPPPPGGEATLVHHRRRDALRLFEPEGELGASLDALDWELEGRDSIGDGAAAAHFSVLTPAGVRLHRRVSLYPGEQHLEMEVWAEAETEELTGRDLSMRLGSGGGILRERDRFYPNPYVAAAEAAREVKDFEMHIPRGRMPSGWRGSVERWNGDFAYLVEGSKYFLSVIRPIDGVFRGAVVEALFDKESYDEKVLEGLSEAEAGRLEEVATASFAILQSEGRPASAAELGDRTGLSPQEASAVLADYFRRGETARSNSWMRASVAGGFTLHIARPGDQTEQRRFQWFLGPKDPKVLALPAYAPLGAVITHVDYGSSFFYRIFQTDLIAPAILWLLRMFHGLSGNWGVAIILMTILVRAMLFPINRTSQLKMAQYQAKMGKLKPQLDAIKKKFADDKQKLNEATFKIYQQHKVRPPVGGCLPVLLQFPVFIGLFAALRCSIRLRHEPFVGYIQDLSRPDALIDFGGPLLDFWPFSGVTTLNILPILMVVLWVVHQRSMPKPADPQQAQMQKMMTFMPIMFGLLLYNYAAGLSMYMITSSLVGIFETKVIKKHWPVAGAGAAATPAI